MEIEMKEELNTIIMDEDVNIKCPQHGNFLSTPGEHLKGYGCPNCRHEDIIKYIKNLNDRLDYCIEHEANAGDNETQIEIASYSREIHYLYGVTKKILDNFKEIRGVK